MRAFTRRGHDWTDRVPSIAAALRSPPVRSATIDGEAVMCGADSVSEFERDKCFPGHIGIESLLSCSKARLDHDQTLGGGNAGDF